MSKIMIVEDQADEVAALTKFLTRAGHTVESAPNGSEALTKILADPPDVILLDLMMPELDGPSLLKVIRSYLRLQSLPVVVLTALSEGPLIEQAEALQVHAILLKGKATSENIQKALEEAVARASGEGS